MIRYKKLGYVELNVTNLDRSIPFYENIVGLEFAGKRNANVALFRCTDDPYAVVLHQADEAGFKRVGWMLEDESQFDNLYRRLNDAGALYEDLSQGECDDRGLARACRTVEPYTSAVQEFYVPPSNVSMSPWQATVTEFKQLGHIVWNSPDRASAVAFFKDVLNFAHSDTIGELATFMRPFPNPYHHGIGIIQTGKTGISHLNFMVSQIDDLGRGIHRFNANEVPIVHGPGRHPASNSVFLYFLDPDGLTLEYSYGMEKFPEIEAREGRTLPMAKSSIDSWGSPRDPRTGSIGTVERYEIGSATSHSPVGAN